MSYFAKLKAWPVIAAFASIQASCGNLESQGGLRIHDLESGANISIQAGDYREVIRAEVSPLRAFYTMSREADNLIIRKRDLNGVELRRSECPLLASIWFGPHWCAISPSGDHLAYFDEKTKRLRVRTLSTGADRSLGGIGIESDTSLTLMRWISETTFVVAAHGRLNNQARGTTFYKAGLNGGVEKMDSVPYDYSPFPSICPNRKHVCGVVDAIGDGRIIIRDTGSLRLAHRVPPIHEAQFVSGYGWSADSQQVYFTLGSGTKQSLHIYDLNTKKLKPGGSLPGRSLVIRGALGDTLAASGQRGGSNAAWVLDTGKGTWHQIGRTNGVIHGIRGTNRYVITE